MNNKLHTKSKFLKKENKVKFSAKRVKEIIRKVKGVIKKRYFVDKRIHGKKIVNDIVYNEKSHIVAKFKDFLLFDDMTEFLRRFYSLNECRSRLHKIYNYYENFSRIFPNYIILPEAKYIYKNIQKKQKMIDNQQRHDEKDRKDKLDDDNIFNTDVYNSIMNQTETTFRHDNSVSLMLKLDHSVTSKKADQSIFILEKLIDAIEGSEKAKYPEKHVTEMNKAVSKNLKLLPITKLINNDDKKPVSVIPIAIDKNMKTLEVKSYTQRNFVETGNKFVTINHSKDNKLKLVLDKGNEKNFESLILHKKYQEIKKRHKFSADISNNTMKIKNHENSTMRENMTNVKENIGTLPLNSDRKKSVKENNKISLNETGKHKATSSMPKFTNNIFYIINQNPVVNTQIMIYNNEENRGKGSEKGIIQPIKKHIAKKKTLHSELENLLKKSKTSTRDALVSSRLGSTNVSKVFNNGKISSPFSGERNKNKISTQTAEQNFSLTSRQMSKPNSVLKNTITSVNDLNSKISEKFSEKIKTTNNSKSKVGHSARKTFAPGYNFKTASKEPSPLKDIKEKLTKINTMNHPVSPVVSKMNPISSHRSLYSTSNMNSLLKYKNTKNEEPFTATQTNAQPNPKVKGIQIKNFNIIKPSPSNVPNSDRVSSKGR